uniref:Uncharacterized protein n=1 Tax=Aegilops tauschii subsp. strangulata TaxID=200361 RepID=A0A453B0B1_AEGTS
MNLTVRTRCLLGLGHELVQQGCWQPSKWSVLKTVRVESRVAATNFTKCCTSVQVEHTHRENTSAFALHIAWSCIIADGCSKCFITLIFYKTQFCLSFHGC